MLSGLFGNSTATTNSIPINNAVSFNIPGKPPVNATLTGNLTVSVPASELNNSTTKIPARLSTGEMTITTGGAGRPEVPVVQKMSAAERQARGQLFYGAEARARNSQTMSSPLGPVYKTGTVPVQQPRARLQLQSNFLNAERAKEQRRANAAAFRRPINNAARLASAKAYRSNHNALARAGEEAGQLRSRATNDIITEKNRLNYAAKQADEYLTLAEKELQAAKEKDNKIQTDYAIFLRDYKVAREKSNPNMNQLAIFESEQDEDKARANNSTQALANAQAKRDQADRDAIKARDALTHFINVTAVQKQINSTRQIHPLARGGRKSRRNRKNNRKTRKNRKNRKTRKN